MGCNTCINCHTCGTFDVCPNCGSKNIAWDEEFGNEEHYKDKSVPVSSGEEEILSQREDAVQKRNYFRRVNRRHLLDRHKFKKHIKMGLEEK